MWNLPVCVVLVGLEGGREEGGERTLGEHLDPDPEELLVRWTGVPHGESCDAGDAVQTRPCGGVVGRVGGEDV